jgi:tryptophan-rich sensory protein
MTRSAIGLLVFLTICLLTAQAGSMLTRPSITSWYAGLAKPAWTPPNWVFAPVWTALYVMMAVAAWLVWKNHGFRTAGLALTLFGAQLALNLGWSALFFALQRPAAAFAEIILLWLMILLTMLAFWKLSPAATWLLLPYLAWVSFAAWLNFAIWRLNIGAVNT